MHPCAEELRNANPVSTCPGAPCVAVRRLESCPAVQRGASAAAAPTILGAGGAELVVAVVAVVLDVRLLVLALLPQAARSRALAIGPLSVLSPPLRRSRRRMVGRE